MVASLNWLYLYDGGVLKRYNKKTGVINDSVKVTGSPYLWGGLDADICDNIYAGSQKFISIYNASMTLTDTINLPDTVYDVKIDAGHKLVYACGRGFVKSISVPFTPLSIASTNATCSCNGTATANLCGGADTANVTYLWSNGGTTQTVSGLCGGKYKVIVTLGGCTPVKYIDSVTITQPTPLVATITAKTNVKCHGGIGDATVSVTGGSKPYTYTWSPSGGSQAKGDSLFAGNYTVMVKDSNGCTATATVTITQPAPFTDTATNTTANCGLSNGTATAAIYGGIAPYSYSWSPGGQTTVTATGLKAGAYVVSVTDSNGCIAKTTTIVPDVGVVPVISGVTGEKCYGGKIGTATITMIGGTAGYTYSWSPGGQTNATGTGLSALTYTATVTDANGCIATDTVTIMQPDSIDIKMKPTNIGCNGDSNGSVIASVTGGSGPYTYSWSPVSGTDSTITGLKVGTYTVA
ncbi:MAG TPA: SprB repeat-containing protein, partial [Bacteroidia bacterium]|nr:SprB repeat-containing protein [Bacteroidia bacterium]